ncbi:MAG: hypothetical protein ABWY25_07000 [Paenisporosarcina sp.]
MEFKESHDERRNLITLTAYISEVELLAGGREFARHVVQNLIKQTILLKQAELNWIADEIVVSQETRDYIKKQIHEEINKIVAITVAEIFKRDDK